MKKVLILFILFCGILPQNVNGACLDEKSYFNSIKGDFALLEIDEMIGNDINFQIIENVLFIGQSELYVDKNSNISPSSYYDNIQMFFTDDGIKAFCFNFITDSENYDNFSILAFDNYGKIIDSLTNYTFTSSGDNFVGFYSPYNPIKFIAITDYNTDKASYGNIQILSVPVPSSFLFLGIGLFFIAAFQRKN